MKLTVIWLVAILANVFLFALIWACWVWDRTDYLGQAFERVQKGDSQTRVVELFGQPPYITTDHDTNTSWDGVWADRTNGVTSVRLLHFYPPFSICGESWEVGFNDHSNAVKKFHILSP
jgi:hypothetical protein